MAKKFTSGQAFKPTAPQFNRYEMAADKVLKVGAKTTPTFNELTRGVVVWGKNNTGAKIEAGKVFAISGFMWGTGSTPESRAAFYTEINVNTATADDTTLDKWVVSAEPIPKNSIGKFFCGGCFVAQYSISNGDYPYLKTETGSDVLVTTPVIHNATAIVLEKDAAAGWALVQKIPFKPHTTFAVAVVEDGGGSAGTASTKCSFTYTVKTKESAVTIATGATPEFDTRTATGAFVAGAFGTAYANEAGEITLYSVSEVPDVGAC